MYRKLLDIKWLYLGCIFKARPLRATLFLGTSWQLDTAKYYLGNKHFIIFNLVQHPTSKMTKHLICSRVFTNYTETSFCLLSIFVQCNIHSQLQLAELTTETTFLKIHTQNKLKKIFPRPFLENQNWANLYITSLIVYTVCVFCMFKLNLSKYIETKLQTSYKAFFKNKKTSGNSLLVSFSV